MKSLQKGRLESRLVEERFLYYIIMANVSDVSASAMMPFEFKEIR